MPQLMFIADVVEPPPKLPAVNAADLRCVLCGGAVSIRPGRGPHFAGSWCSQCHDFRWIPKLPKEKRLGKP
jgi:hypothetical protein